MNSWLNRMATRMEVLAMKSSRLVALALVVAGVVLMACRSEAGLVAHWAFDEGSGTTAFEPVGSHDGTLTNGPVWVTDTPPTAFANPAALSFDNSNDYVVATGYKGVTGTGARTVSAWIKTPSNGDEAIASWGQDAGGSKWILRVQDDNGTKGALRVEVSGGYIVGSTILGDNQWHHVAAVLPTSGSPNVTDVLLYVDGVLEGNSASQGRAINTASASDVRIAQDHSNRYFNGLIDDVRLYDNALSAAEVQALAVRVLPLPKTYSDAVHQDGAFAYWRLGDASGTTAVNSGSVGAALDATYNGNVSLGAPSLLVFGGDGAAQFDGSANTRVNMPDHLLVNTGGPYLEKTIELWFQADDVQARQVLYEQGGTMRGLNIYIDGGLLYVGGWNRAETSWNPIFLSTPIEANATYMVDLVLDGVSSGVTGSLTGYLNGEPFDTQTGVSKLWSHGDDGAIGAMRQNAVFHTGDGSGEGFEFGGIIDDISIYNHTLTAQQIAAHYFLSTVPEPATLFVMGSGLLALAHTRRKGKRRGKATKDAARALAVALTLGLLCLSPRTGMGGIAMEADTVSFPQTTSSDTDFFHVTFAEPFTTAPLVFILPTNEGSDPCDIRIRNVTPTGFDASHVEPLNLDGTHAAMTAAYFAVEPGTAILPDGTILHAGSIDTATTVHHAPPFPNGGGWETINFPGLYSAAPAFLAQIQTTVNETGLPPSEASSPWVSAAVQNIASTSAQVALERAEVNDGAAVSANETIGYLAITPRASMFDAGAGTTILYDAMITPDIIKGWTDSNPDGDGYSVSFRQTFGSAPLVIGNLAKRDGADGGWLRRCDLSATAVKLICDEDTYYDGERGHTDEAAAILAVSQPFHACADVFTDEFPYPTLRYVAPLDTTANTTWENITGATSNDFSLAANARVPVSERQGWRLGEAYVFPAAAGTATTLESFAGNPTDESASFELWFLPDDLVGQEVVWECGGSQNGSAIAIDGGTVLFNTSSNTDPTTKQLSGGHLRTNLFNHVVGVVDLEGLAGDPAFPDLYLYVNGQLADSELDVDGFVKWAGGDAMGMGAVAGTSIGGNRTGMLDGFGGFGGQIAMFNFYDQAITGEQIAAMYLDMTIPEPGTLALLAGGLLALARRRRNRR